MDYKYIEQLLERYWEAETTLDEERILRSFFSCGGQVPAHLQRYIPLFAAWQSASNPALGADFEARVMAAVEAPTVKARRITWRSRVLPLLKAAAVIAVFLSAGAITQRSMQPDEPQMASKEAQPREDVIDVQVAYEPSQPVDSVKVLEETY